MKSSVMFRITATALAATLSWGTALTTLAAEPVAISVADTDEAQILLEEGVELLYHNRYEKSNLDAAKEKLEQAAALGNTKAYVYLGILYDQMDYEEVGDFSKALSYYLLAGDEPLARFAIGFLYFKGQGVPVDTDKAYEIFQELADEGEPAGYSGLSFYYINMGEFDLAVEYNQLAQQTTTDPFILGSTYNTLSNILYRLGASNEEITAASELALTMYDDPCELANVGNNYTMSDDAKMIQTGISYIRQVYKYHPEIAKFYLFDAYLRGIVSDPDENELRDVYNKIVDGEITSDYMETIYSLRSDGMYEIAYNLAVNAMAKGSAEGMQQIGVMYREGQYVEQDYDAARAWLNLAIEAGSENAKESLEILEERIAEEAK